MPRKAASSTRNARSSSEYVSHSSSEAAVLDVGRVFSGTYEPAGTRARATGRGGGGARPLNCSAHPGSCHDLARFAGAAASPASPRAFSVTFSMPPAILAPRAGRAVTRDVTWLDVRTRSGRSLDATTTNPKCRVDVISLGLDRSFCVVPRKLNDVCVTHVPRSHVTDSGVT